MRRLILVENASSIFQLSFYLAPLPARCSLISQGISTPKQKVGSLAGQLWWVEGELGVPSQVFISSLYIPKLKKEMNLKFDSTQFRCSLPGKVASSLHNYKIKQIGEHSVIVSTEKWETKFSMRPPIRTSTSPKCTQLTKVLPFPGMIRYNQESKHQVKRIKLWSFRHSWEMGKDFSKRGPSLPFKAKTRTHVDFSPQRNIL